MNKKRKIIFIFVLSFIITFLIVRYFNNPTHLRADHARNLTPFEHFKVHLILTLAYDVKQAVFMATITTIIYSLMMYIESKRRLKKNITRRG